MFIDVQTQGYREEAHEDPAYKGEVFLARYTEFAVDQIANVSAWRKTKGEKKERRELKSHLEGWRGWGDGGHGMWRRLLRRRMREKTRV